MSNGYLKALLPHLLAIVVLIVVSAAFYAPSISGKVLSQSDNVQAVGMQKEINEVREQGKAHPLWTNSMFGGMPVYQIHMPLGGNFTGKISKFFLLGGKITSPFHSMFLMMAMFYILMAAMGVDWRMGVIGAIAYGLATNHIVLTEAGHTTKLITMAYLPPTLAGILLAFRGKYWPGFALTALFLSLQVLANHVQITYYFFIALLFLGLFEGVKAAQSKALPQFGKAVAVLALAGIVGIGANTARLWTTYEYVEETIRGKSELAVKGQFAQSTGEAKQEDGLSKDYIFDWSYGVGETFTILIPDYMGRKSGSFVNDRESKTYAVWQQEIQKLQQQGNQDINQVAQTLAQAANTYRGDVPFTSGPIYFGAVICFLFVLGLILLQGPMKWWLLTATILMAMLGWGRNFPALNFFLYEHLPMFNKFRAVMMALGVGQLFVTFLGILALKDLAFNTDIPAAQKSKSVLLAGGITGGLTLLIYLASMGGFIDMASPRDPELLTQFPNLAAAIYGDRAAMLQADALRTLLFVVLAAGALWAVATDKIKWTLGVIAVGVLVLVDFWGVNRRFLTHEDFQDPIAQQTQVQPRPVDQQVMNDPDPHFRVLDLSRGGNPFTSAIPSYFHKSMGGYHAAKLMRFQDLCEHYLFSGNPMANQYILGMFNTKYFILNNPQTNEPYAATNPSASGPAWFVRDFQLVPDADAEIKALAQFDPRATAFIEQAYAEYMDGYLADSTITPGDNISLVSYAPDRMVYKVKATKERLALFAEMYYPPSKGWHVYINGERKSPDFIKANYAIRAARVPAGEYELEMRFEPQSYHTGKTIGLICSLLIFGALGFYLYRSYRDFDAAAFAESQAAAKATAAPSKAAKAAKVDTAPRVKPTSPQQRQRKKRK